jgi:hypothetical protein
MSLEQLNLTLSKFYSNLTVKGTLLPPKNRITRWEVVGHELNELYTGFVKSHNFELGRVGAINLEQLDVLLESLKTYWDYSNQKSFLDEIKAPGTGTYKAENVFAYEL